MCGTTLSRVRHIGATCCGTAKDKASVKPMPEVLMLKSWLQHASSLINKLAITGQSVLSMFLKCRAVIELQGGGLERPPGYRLHPAV